MPKAKKTSDEILEIWGSDDPITAKGLSERAGISLRTAWYWIGTLREDGLIDAQKRTGPRGKGVRSIYAFNFEEHDRNNRG